MEMTSYQECDLEDWEEDNGMLTSQSDSNSADPIPAGVNDEVYKVLDFASALRVNEQFKVIKFYWPNKSLLS